MSRMMEIQSWDDEKLVKELRNPMREKIPDSLTLLIAEAVARLLAMKADQP